MAVIVPHRNRAGQLAVLLAHLHPFLARQQLHYRIYVVTQVRRVYVALGMIGLVGKQT